MSKKLNIIEAMKMPIGTLFEVYSEGIKAKLNAKIVEIFNSNGKKELVWSNRAYIKVFVTDSISDATFIKIQQPVNFMEVVNSNKKCRVEHGAITDFLKDKKPNEYWYLQDDRYHHLTEIVSILSYVFYPELFNRVIKESKWYLEESEELEDERLS